MSKLHVYLKPFDTTGAYESDWTEVTKDVDVQGIGTLTQQLDNTEYDVGIFRNSNLRLKLRNDHGRYIEAGEIGSIFKHKRADTKVKITWEPGDESLICGFFSPGPGAVLSEEVEVFKGLLDDKAAKTDADKQDIQFTVFGQEILFEREITPYASISNGDSFESVIYTLLNQSSITDHLTVSAGNISCGINETIDDKSDLENQTVKEALEDILLPSNSVLYIENDTVYVSPRTAGATLEHTFYGQGSDDGTENILELKNHRTGHNRVLNYWTWKDTTLKSSDSSSVTTNGTSKKEIELSLVSSGSTAKIQNILDSLKDEFKNPKAEMDLSATLNIDTLALFLLDRVSIDYPTIVLAKENENIPIYGIAVYGEDSYPIEVSSLTIPSTDRFKIMARKINFKKETIEFSVREI